MMTMNLNKLSVWAVGACLCAASFSHAAAAGIDSYDAALKKVKEVKEALDPLKSKNRLKNWVNLGLQLEGLKKGNDVNGRDAMTWSPLAWAAYVGDKEIFDYLLSKGANPKAVDQYGISIFMRAVEGGNMDIVKYLMEECKYDANEKDREFGTTALMRAATCRRNDILAYLIDRKASVKARDKGGRNVLAYAADGRNMEGMEMLVAKGADLNGTDKEGHSILMKASERGCLDMVKYLVKKGAKVKGKTRHGKTALIYAAEGGYLDVAGFLVDHGADIKAKNKWGDTVLDIKTVDPAVKNYLHSKLKVK